MATGSDKYKNLGNKALDDGKYKEALEYFERAIRLDPKSTEAWTRKAAAEIYLRQYSNAITACDKALVLDKKNADAWFNRGLAFDRRQNYDKALDNYENALRYNPRHIKALNNQGTVLGQLERWDEAKRSFEKVLEFEPKNEDAKENLKLLSDFKAGKHKSRCFIATAAYGYPQAYQIRILKLWRDNNLLSSRSGKTYVKIYYRISPKLAAVIARSKKLRAIVRAGIEPFILYFSRRMRD
jgi:tetratricopeptide (TPR) repeat protein